MDMNKFLKVFERKNCKNVFEDLKECIFEVMKKRFGSALELESVDQICLTEESCNGRIEEVDGNCYPALLIYVRANSKDFKKFRELIFVGTPFNCYINGTRKEFSDYGKTDKYLTFAYRCYLSELAGCGYEEAVEEFAKRTEKANINNMVSDLTKL